MTIKDFRDRRALRSRETVGAGDSDGYLTIGKERVYVGEQRFTLHDLTRAELAMGRWRRHTDDTDRNLAHIEAALRRDRIWSWCLLSGLVGVGIGYCIARWVWTALGK